LERGDVDSLEHWANSVPLPEAQILGYCEMRTDTFDQHTLYSGGSVFTLGGKTTLWGASCPRVNARDLVRWPPKIVDDFFAPQPPTGRNFMDLAADSLHVKPLEDPTYYSTGIMETLEASFKDGPVQFSWESNTMAIQWDSPFSFQLPGLLYSTAVPIFNLAMNGSICLKLNHQVIHVQDGPTKVVTALNNNKNKVTFRGKVVVIAAGALETGRIIHNSALSTSRYLNIGFTDHLLISMSAQLIPNSSWENSERAAKIMGYPLTDLPASYIMDMAINTASFLIVDQSPGFTPPLCPRSTLLPPEICGKTNHPAPVAGIKAVIVALLSTPLNDRNNISFTSHGTYINMEMGVVSEELLDQIKTVGEKMMKTLHFAPLGPWQVHCPGYVAHEGGNARIGQVVNSDLQLVGHPGIYVADASIYPFIIAQNPSHLLAAHAIRLAWHISSTHLNQ